MPKNQENHNFSDAIGDLISLTKDDMDCVNDLIFEKIGSNVSNISDVCEYLISSGGKRLRPMLTLLSARMFGYTKTEHIKLALAVEFMHTATLLHDDVVDESDLRRGKKTARKVWGNQTSILVGDFLLGQAFKAMVDVGSLEALSILSSAAVLISEGEVMQLNAAQNIQTTIDIYLKIIEAKTAILFAAACEIGPIIAEKNEMEREAMKNYGLYLGMAFQLVDDALDYGGNSHILGKNIGDDFREGKVTWPIIACYEKADDCEKEFIKQAIEDGCNDDLALEKILFLIQKYNSISHTLDMAKFYGDKAKSSLSNLKESVEKKVLLNIIDFCISRLK